MLRSPSLQARIDAAALGKVESPLSDWPREDLRIADRFDPPLPAELRAMLAAGEITLEHLQPNGPKHPDHAVEVMILRWALRYQPGERDPWIDAAQLEAEPAFELVELSLDEVDRLIANGGDLGAAIAHRDIKPENPLTLPRAACGGTCDHDPEEPTT
jgi:hypothetical protein